MVHQADSKKLVSTCREGNAKNPLRQNQSGQIVVEYVLLLLVAVAIAAMITKAMISSDKDNPGFVMTAWQNLVTEIAADHADDIQR